MNIFALEEIIVLTDLIDITPGYYSMYVKWVFPPVLWQGHEVMVLKLAVTNVVVY